MSGPFGSSQWMYSSGEDFYPHKINQSLKLDDSATMGLDRNLVAATSEKKATISFWTKRSNMSTDIPSAQGQRQVLFYTGESAGGNEMLLIEFLSDAIRILFHGSGTYKLTTTGLFRDPAAWYHIFLKVDTTQATAADSAELYINGVQVTNFSEEVYPTQNLDLNIHAGNVNYLGGVFSLPYAGYFAEYHYLDGTAKDVTDFGETKSGIWIPKQYTGGSYGNNGFYLTFEATGTSTTAQGTTAQTNIGDDQSGEGHNFGLTSIVSEDVVGDSPTNSFSTLNPLHGAGQLSEGNLRQDGASGDWGTRGSTFTVSSGKWYFEGRTVDGTTTQGIMFGVSRRLNIPSGEHVGENAVDYSFYTYNATKYNNNSASAYGSAFADGDICGVALDLTAGTLTFYKNGTTMGVAFSSLPSGDYTFYGSAYGTATYHTNFGADSTFNGLETAGGNADDNGNGDFAYSPPSGHLALCAASLPDPDIDPAQDDTPEDYFNTVLYTGNGSSQAITVGFAPDLVWVKNRGEIANGIINDTIRGAGVSLQTPSASDELGSAGDLFDSLDSNGFTVNADFEGADNPSTNRSANTYVAWNWLAGGTASNNDDGTIQTSLSANTKAGFSLATWTGNATAGATIGHGLDSAPEMLWIKDRDDDGYNWIVYHKDVGNDRYLLLNTNASQSAASQAFLNSTTPDDDVVTLGGTGWGLNQSGDSHVGYFFHSVPGYSLVSSYTGNGSSTGDGPYVHCGFRPAWLMVKASSAGGEWYVLDSKRDTHNLTQNRLFPNSSAIESASTTNGPVDFLSNGFKARSTSTNNNNASGQTYIFVAFAEQPFKYANAR